MRRRVRCGAFLVVCGLATVATPAQATERVTAERIERQLAAGGEVVVSDAKVVGDVTIRPGDRLTATDVHFAGSVASDASVRPARRGVFEVTGARFDETVNLSGLGFTTLQCVRCEFTRDFDFHSAAATQLRLTGSSFHGFATFIAATAEMLDLIDVRFDKVADFSGADIGTIDAARLRAGEPVVITWHQLGDDWAAARRAFVAHAPSDRHRDAYRGQVEAEFRFWKRNFEALGQQKDAQEANHELVKMTREGNFDPLRPTTWLPYVLEVGNAYGTDPNRPIWVGIGVIVAFWIIYALIEGRRPAIHCGRHALSARAQHADVRPVPEDAGHRGSGGQAAQVALAADGRARERRPARGDRGLQRVCARLAGSRRARVRRACRGAARVPRVW